MQELKLRGNPEQFNGICSRAIVLRKPAEDDNGRAIRGIIATEQPVIVWDWYKWEPIREVLLVDGGNIPDKVPMLDAHSRFEISNIKGSTTNFNYEEHDSLGMILTGDNVFSTTAEKEYTLAKEGHLDSTSIGYRVNSKETVVIEKGGQAEIDGRTFKNDFEDGLQLVIRKKWDLMENSLVPIGADKAAKFRSMFKGEAEQENIVNLIREEQNEINNNLKIIINKGDQIKMDQDQVKLEAQRVESIDKLAKDFKDQVKNLDLKQLAELYKTSNKSVNDFSDKILANIEAQASVAKPTVELTPKEVKRYSISNALAHLLDPKRGDCFEFEVSRDYQKRTGIDSGGFIIPHNYLDSKMQRDVTKTLTAGGDFIGTDHLSGEWIDVLRNETLAAKLGVRFLPGRKGNISIPKLTTGNTFGWAATENAVVLESSPVTTKVEMSPKRGGFFVDISKTAIIQSDPALDSVLTEDGRQTMAIGLDQGLFHGAGSGGAFTGIAATSNVQSVVASSMDWAKALEFVQKIKTSNAVLGELKFAFNPGVEASLMGRAKEAGYPVYIIGEDGKLAGRSYEVSNQISDNYIFFGSFNQAYMALWDGLDVTVDPYTLATHHLVRITFNQLADVAVRHPQAFVVASDFS